MHSREVMCPECEKMFELDSDLEEGDVAYCCFCDTELKIARLDPPRVEIIRQVFDNDNEKDGDGYPDYS